MLKIVLYSSGLLLLLILMLAVSPGFANRPGERKPGRPAHHSASSFRNPFPTFKPHSGWSFLKWQWDRLRGRVPEKPETYHFEIDDRAASALRTAATGLRVTWIGHATTLLQVDSVTILTDPIFSERSSPIRIAGPRRKVPPVPALAELPPIDAVLISHNHYDHLDKDTIKKLGNGPHYFVPLFIGKFLRGLGIKRENITELDWWESSIFRGLEFHCTPTQHFSGRGFHDTNKTLWCSWTVIGENYRFYFGGDTGYFPGFYEIGKRYGPFDLALLPIGAYLPRWFMAPVHMSPAESAQAFLDLKAKNMLAIHWGTFDLADERMDQPPRDLIVAADSLGIARERVWIFKRGETREVSLRR